MCAHMKEMMHNVHAFSRVCMYLCKFTLMFICSKDTRHVPPQVCISVLPLPDLCFLLVCLNVFIMGCRATSAEPRASSSRGRLETRSLPEYMKALHQTSILFTFLGGVGRLGSMPRVF